MSDLRKQLESEPCTCVKCTACNGTGTYWMTAGGRYLGSARCDDLDELELCEFCDHGYTETCGRCQMLADLDHEEEERTR